MIHIFRVLIMKLFSLILLQVTTTIPYIIFCQVKTFNFHSSVFNIQRICLDKVLAKYPFLLFSMDKFVFSTLYFFFVLHLALDFILIIKFPYTHKYFLKFLFRSVSLFFVVVLEPILYCFYNFGLKILMCGRTSLLSPSKLT